MKTKGIILIMGIWAALYFGMGQIETYFSVGTSVPIRLKMLRNGISIAQRYFPFGQALVVLAQQ